VAQHLTPGCYFEKDVAALLALAAAGARSRRRLHNRKGEEEKQSIRWIDSPTNGANPAPATKQKAPQTGAFSCLKTISRNTGLRRSQA